MVLLVFIKKEHKYLKHLLIVVLFTSLFIGSYAQSRVINGSVKSESTPLGGVAVTDGFNMTLTDEFENYILNVSERNQYLFIFQLLQDIHQLATKKYPLFITP